jgi:NADH:ubiquinone oxidoreductase subunit C
VTTNLKHELQSLPGATALYARRDGWWMAAPDLDVRAVATLMHAHQARLSTISAFDLPDGETQVIYHYLQERQAFNLKVSTHSNVLPSISSILPAADWIEREIQDLYGVEFSGHPHPQRLIRPNQLEAGFFRATGGAAGRERS